MFRALRNSWRLLRLALSFARHDALFPLEILGIAPALIAWVRLFRSRRDRRRPGERLAAALQDTEVRHVLLANDVAISAWRGGEAMPLRGRPHRPGGGG